MLKRELERRDNCGCASKRKVGGYERRDNRGSPPTQGYDDPSFWDMTPLQVGWAVGAGIVLIAVVVIESAKAAQRKLDARGTSAPQP